MKCLSYPVVEEDNSAEGEHVVEAEGEQEVGLLVPVLWTVILGLHGPFGIWIY